MVQSLRRLLGECIDYSGLTGLTELTVTEAVERYLRYQGGTEAWILSRFVCPSKKLHELTLVLSKMDFKRPFPVAVLGNPTRTNDEWENELASAAELMNAFETSTPDEVEVAAFEIAPPAMKEFSDVLKDLQGFSEVDVFIEVGLTHDFDHQLHAIADSDWAFLRADLTGHGRPDSFAVAKLLHEAIALEAPVKLVQGTGRAVSSGSEIGLINLFGAVAIGLAEDLSKREMEAVLIDGEWTNWRFDLDSVCYRGWEADEESLELSREILLDTDCASVEHAIDELSTLGFAVREGV